jgi:mono/diheme cytochrome c family protein
VTVPRARGLALVVLLAAGALAAGGCGGSGDDDAAAGTTTAAAPAATAPATTAQAPATTAPATTAVAPAGPGDVAAGKQVFVANSCAGCHKGLGTKPGYGPKLAGKGLSEATIRTAVIEGGSLMPGGLVEGQDLADVVAYVSSLQ